MLAFALALLLSAQELRAPQPAQVECFALEGPERSSIGWLRLLERELEGGRALEAEWTLLRSGQTPWELRHVEELRAHNWRLIWRERSELAGRSLMLEPVPATGDWRLEVVEREDRIQRALDLGSGGVLPLALLEMCRRGDLAVGSLRVFEPLQAGFAGTRVRTRYSWQHPERRIVEWQRDAAEQGIPQNWYWCFEGRSLVGFRLGPALSGRRIQPEEWRLAVESARRPLVAASGR